MHPALRYIRYGLRTEDGNDCSMPIFSQHCADKALWQSVAGVYVTQDCWSPLDIPLIAFSLSIRSHWTIPARE